MNHNPTNETNPGPRASRPHRLDIMTASPAQTRAGELSCNSSSLLKEGGRDARGPGRSPHRIWHHRGYLPHFDAGTVVQMITFRLADSLPRDVYARIRARDQDEAEKRRRIEEMIDSGRGACILRNPQIANIVARALKHFDGERYRLLRWVVMPNHVHVLIEQIDGHSLNDVVQTWKSFAAKKINSARNAIGSVWAADYFDRFARNRQHFGDAVSYIENNPVKAGLVSRPGEWPFSSVAEDAGGTPAVPGNESFALSGLI